MCVCLLSLLDCNDENLNPVRRIHRRTRLVRPCKLPQTAHSCVCRSGSMLTCVTVRLCPHPQSSHVLAPARSLVRTRRSIERRLLLTGTPSRPIAPAGSGRLVDRPCAGDVSAHRGTSIRRRVERSSTALSNSRHCRCLKRCRHSHFRSEHPVAAPRHLLPGRSRPLSTVALPAVPAAKAAQLNVSSRSRDMSTRSRPRRVVCKCGTCLKTDAEKGVRVSTSTYHEHAAVEKERIATDRRAAEVEQQRAHDRARDRASRDQVAAADKENVLPHQQPPAEALKVEPSPCPESPPEQPEIAAFRKCAFQW